MLKSGIVGEWSFYLKKKKQKLKEKEIEIERKDL
jgi:hypothetical protein